MVTSLRPLVEESGGEVSPDRLLMTSDLTSLIGWLAPTVEEVS